MNISDQFASSRRLLLVLKRAVKLRIPLEQAFDHIAPLEIGYRAGLSRRSLNRFHSLVQAGEEPLAALSKAASHMMPPALSAILSFAARKGTLAALLDDVCPELHESPKSPVVQQLATVYIMLLHGVTLILCALIAAMILPKLMWCFVGTDFEAINQLPRIGTVWVAGSVGVLISLFFVFLFVKTVWTWVWYSGASGMSRCWMSSRSWEASRMVSAVVWMTQHGANEAEALDELLSALPQKSSMVRRSVGKAFSAARSGAPWGEIAPALIAFAGGKATSSAKGIPAAESPGVWAESFFSRVRADASRRYRFAATYLLPLETGLAGGVTGWILVFVYRFMQNLQSGYL